MKSVDDGPLNLHVLPDGQYFSFYSFFPLVSDRPYGAPCLENGHRVVYGGLLSEDGTKCFFVSAVSKDKPKGLDGPSWHRLCHAIAWLEAEEAAEEYRDAAGI